MGGDEWVVGGDRVGEEDGAVERVGWARVYGVGGEEEEEEDERVGPCVPEGEGFPAPEEAFCFSSFGERAEGFGLGASLVGGLVSLAMGVHCKYWGLPAYRCQGRRVEGRRRLESRQC